MRLLLPSWGLRSALKRVKPLQALYESLRATPTPRDGLTFALYRSLIWLVHGTRFWRRLNVTVGGLSRRLRLTFSLKGPSALPVRLTLSVQPQTYWTLYEIFFAHGYHPVKPIAPSVVVDAGANIGLATVYLHALFPSARFLCVEADPTNLPVLRRNLDQNGVTYELVHAALGRTQGSTAFRVHRAASDYSSTRTTSFPDDEYRLVTVPATTLEALLTVYNVDRVGLLKIDIEGAEFDVLEPTDAALRRLDYITGEFHGFAGAVDALADGACHSAGLAVLRRAGNADLATFHIGRPD